MRFWGPRWSDRWSTLLLVAVFVLLEVFASHQRLRVAALFAAGVAVFVCERSTRSKAALNRSEAIDKANLSLAALRASCCINEIGSKNMIVHLARHGDEDALAYLNLIRRK